MKALEFYSGIGGLHLALKTSKVEATVCRAFDWDQNACKVYEANHGSGLVEKIDISTLTASELGSYDAEMWLLSPSCQPYTVLNPSAKGEMDPRAQSFLHLIQNVLPEMVSSSTQPTHLLVENVAGFETSTTRPFLLQQLQQLGYFTAEFLLTPLQFGIPNSRLRYYLLARRTPFPFDSDAIQRSIPGLENATPSDCFEAGGAAAATNVPEIRAYLNAPTDSVGSSWHPHAIPDRVLKKWGRLFDIVLPSSRRTCCFTRGYTQLVERAGSILQTNEELDTTATFDTFLASDDPDAVRMLHPLGLRYFSPSELLRLFAFEEQGSSFKFTWPPDVSTKSKYRLIGNSVNVKVVRHLIEFLCDDSIS
ncbi:dna methyltransferase [Moniliophthora roreri MCA 2997]|uniref:tRNA (cytosine(38)-C(5))-methyltransferase n=1 Tax=Moniliophthora roreri (strain MCA 2997) TaxID=1381753 RepID=V2WNN3_MONRO|nr:dna methyltransferase [Moniliophthora roreri MCA 2997]